MHLKCNITVTGELNLTSSKLLNAHVQQFSLLVAYCRTLLLSNKIFNCKNHKKSLIHESATKCAWFHVSLFLNSPLHHAVHIVTS